MLDHVWYESLNPLNFLERSAFVYPNKPAVLYQDRRYTYAEFYDRVNQLAGALRQAGVQPGDRVAFLVPNVLPMMEGHYGPLRLGAILVAINIRLSPREVAYILNHSGAKVLVFDSEFASTVQAVRDEVKGVSTFVQVVDAVPQAHDIPGPDYESFLATAPAGDHRADRKNDGERQSQVADELRQRLRLFLVKNALAFHVEREARVRLEALGGRMSEQDASHSNTPSAVPA